MHGLGFSAADETRPVAAFSGGWRMRLNLAQALMCRSDLLLLDEPTNHLDLATREALAVALNEFEGTLMLVSHDRALLRSVCDEFWLVGRGRVGDFDGDLDDYQRYLLDEAKRLREEARLATREAAETAAAIPAAAPSPQAAAQERQQRSNQAKPLKRELAQIDEQLAAAGAEKTSLEARLSTPLPAPEIAETGRRLKALNEEIGRLEERWLALSDEIETLAAT
jgi:ATP-binding cassette subfamily F protein 3